MPKISVIVPVYNERGEVVAFGARIFNSDNGPKYLNSQETLVYNKSTMTPKMFRVLLHDYSLLSTDHCPVMVDFDIN